MIADGNPAATRTVNKVGLTRNGVSEETQGALRQAYKTIFREGLTVAKAIETMENDLQQVLELKELIEFMRTSERGLAR
jgi:UDP-N-acetylglucosamine acyltransferase